MKVVAATEWLDMLVRKANNFHKAYRSYEQKTTNLLAH